MSAPSTTVLIVDDSAADRELVGRMLASHFRVLTAADMLSGLETFRHERPECVLLDHRMPGIDGLEGLTQLMKEHAVVIMMSGTGGEEIAAEAIKRGARDFIRKSALTAPVLLRMIMREHERRRLEVDLHATRERFDEVAARIAEILWVRSLDGEFLYLSPAFEQVWGLPRAEMTPERWMGFVHPDDRDLKAEIEGQWVAGVEYETEFRIVRPDGQTRRIKNRGYPIFEDGRLARYGGIARDITDDVRLQQELRLAQKLEAIGQLAAGVAHEINTPAQYVSDNLTFLAESVRELMPLLGACAELVRSDTADLAKLRDLARRADIAYLIEELPSALQQSATGIGQIKKIVQAMKEFSHPSDDMKAIDLNSSIETTVTVAKNEWKYVADVELDLAPDLPGVACYPSEINQVLLNLIVNAAHAIEDVVGRNGSNKGKITITTGIDGDYAVIGIADTGCGIPSAIRDRIFDPFFTTKGIGKGTGQGLAITHRIVCEHHAGTIDFDSTVDQGTRFVIRLPIAGAPEATERHAAASNAAEARAAH